MDPGRYPPNSAQEMSEVSRGVPMWHMGENGPAQMMIPFPSGQGTDGEIDKWLAQTRAVARLHHGPMPPYTRRDGHDIHRPMLRAEMRDEASSARATASRAKTGQESANHGVAVSSGPSSIQSLREMVAPSAPNSADGANPRAVASRANPGPAIHRPLPQNSAATGQRGSFTAAGRQVRPRQLDAYPIDKMERSEAHRQAARTAGGAGADASSRAVKKGCKALKKSVTPPGKVPTPAVKPAAEFADISIFPRRKAGQSGIGNNRPAVVITREVLEQHFNMPLLSVCKKLVCSHFAAACAHSHTAECCLGLVIPVPLLSVRSFDSHYGDPHRDCARRF